MKLRDIIKGKKVGSLIIALIFISTSVVTLNAQEIRLVSMDFQEAALKDVLKVFSQQAGLNFVATTNIESKSITLYLDGVSVQDALNSIMKANSLTYEQAPGSNVFIVKESGRSKIDLETRVYALNFARLSGASGEGSKTQVSDIKSVLDNLLSKGEDGSAPGSIVLDKRTNSIIVTSIPEDFVTIEETIKKLDAMTPQALIEAEIVEIQTSSLKRLGLEWGGSDGTFVRFTGPVKVTHFPFIRQSNPFSRSLIGTSTSQTTTSTDTATIVETAAQDPTLGTLSLQEFSIVLKALETMGEARYLAKPRIMTINNETAQIDITADTVIGVKTTSVTDTGEVVEEAERTETGISLKVTPTINKQGFITMTLEPEVSRAVQSPMFVNFADPAKRSAKTTVMVRDGQTVAIGGLLKTDETKDNRKLPGLSRIPFIGKMFQRDTKSSYTTELIIFITAHAIMDVEELNSTDKACDDVKEPVKVAEAEHVHVADNREAEIKKSVMKLRKKRDLERKRK